MSRLMLYINLSAAGFVAAATAKIWYKTYFLTKMTCKTYLNFLQNRLAIAMYS